MQVYQARQSTTNRSLFYYYTRFAEISTKETWPLPYLRIICRSIIWYLEKPTSTITTENYRIITRGRWYHRRAHLCRASPLAFAPLLIIQTRRNTTQQNRRPKLAGAFSFFLFLFFAQNTQQLIQWHDAFRKSNTFIWYIVILPKYFSSILGTIYNIPVYLRYETPHQVAFFVFPPRTIRYFSHRVTPTKSTRCEISPLSERVGWKLTRGHGEKRPPGRDCDNSSSSSSRSVKLLSPQLHYAQRPIRQQQQQQQN